MLEGKVWLTCLRTCCMAHACSLDRRKKAVHYIQNHPLRPHHHRNKVKKKEIQLTLKNCQEEENEVISG